MAKYLVIGAGAWGTALAFDLARNNHQIILWTNEETHAQELTQDKENKRFLPGFHLDENISISHSDDLFNQLDKADRILVAVPSHAFRSVLEFTKNHWPLDKGIVWATKGLDPKSGHFLGHVVDEVLGQDIPQALLTGPSFATEVAKGEPTEVNLATNNLEFGKQVKIDFDQAHFKTYLTEDILGAEIGGAVKNVASITVGIADGLGYGMNTKAMLMNKGLFEMRRFATALGANPDTVLGPCGVGDLILTCSDNQSRNRRFGVMLGQGVKPEDAYAKIGQVVEGVTTAATLTRVADEHNVDAPLTRNIHAYMQEIGDPRALIERLLG